MQERIFEIIVYVMSQVRLNDKMLSEINFNQLEDMGYSDSEISTALSWILDSGELTPGLIVNESMLPSAASFRILSEMEKDYFTDEAWGELQVLQNLGVILPVHIEYVIEKAVMYGLKNIGLDMMKAITSAVLFNRMLEPGSGNKVYLNGNESIN